jgi:hypothetical protein
MTRTAKELYEIVKDVDPAIWPDITYHDYEELWSTHHCIAHRGPVEVDLAEAAFVGAMVAWRIERGTGTDPHPFKSGNEYIVWNDRECHVAPTLIEALAAACKQKQEDDDGN